MTKTEAIESVVEQFVLQYPEESARRQHLYEEALRDIDLQTEEELEMLIVSRGFASEFDAPRMAAALKS